MARSAVSADLDQRDDFAELPDQLPLLPVRDLAVFPFMVVPLFVSRPISLAAVEEALAADRRLFLVAQRDPHEASPGLDDLYSVGTLGKILRVQRHPDAQVKILVQGLRRIRMQRVLREQPALVVRPEPLADPGGEIPKQQIEGTIRAVKASLKRLEEVGKGLPDEVMTVLMGLNEPGALADLVASNLSLKVSDAQLVLETASPMGRLTLVNDMLAREAEVMAWKQKIQTQAKAEMSRTQREYFLREQLKQIRHELGDIDGKQEELDELRGRLSKAGLPVDAEREAKKQLRRLDAMSTESAEAAVVRTYLDWLADLPWSATSSDRIDLHEAKRILDEDHYGLDHVKDRILEYLGVLKLKGDHRGPILCFVGPPGVGKTTIGRSIAKAVGRKFVRVSLGGVHDESEIRGHRRTYVGAMPGRIIGGLKQAGTCNPVFMLDELDKLGKDGRGDPSAALLEVLDPEQNSTFRDHYMNLPFDLSRVLWVATANVVESMPPALRDRMEIIHLPGYDLEEKVTIARRFLIPNQTEAAGLRPQHVVISNGAVETLIDRYTREAGLRGLERQIAALCRKVARRIVEGKAGQASDGSTKRVRIGGKDLERYLGPPKHDPDRPDESDRIGLATGLAWTEAGGRILHVEATAMPGQQGLTLTGQLGPVMKESATAALSYARTKIEDFGLTADVFKDRELHVHVPKGAIPKDGPSAGITMATALVSLLTECPIRRDIAMTGEITLRGRVLGVGGLRQKLLAAARAGIREVLVPVANEPDLKEMPARLRQQVTIRPVAELDEVLAIALVGFEGRMRRRGPSGRVPKVGVV